MRLNLAYFHYAYKDVQLRSTAPPAVPGNAILQNAASERFDGVDGDFSVAAAKGLVLNGSFEWLRAKYVDFPGTTLATAAPLIVVNGVTLGGTATTQGVNLGGYNVPLAAPFSASIGFTYTLDTSAGAFSLSANDHYNASYPMTNDSSVFQEQHHVVDASLNWTTPNKRFDVNLFVRNFTKQYVYGVGQVSTSFVIVPAAPRTFGATVGFHY